ncbi:hypothetical protein V1504DRAFT_460999 [Lipomyces starkeyi]
MAGSLLSSQSAIQAFINIPDEASSTITETPMHSSNPLSQVGQRQATVSEWLWGYFETTTIDKDWIDRKEEK